MQPSEFDLVKKDLISLSDHVGICADCTHLIRLYKVYNPIERWIYACGYSATPEHISGKMIFCNDFNKPSFIISSNE